SCSCELPLQVGDDRSAKFLLPHHDPGDVSLTFFLIEIGGEILGDEAVKEHPERIALEIPAIDAAAQVVGDPPDRFVQLRPLLVPWCHARPLAPLHIHRNREYSLVSRHRSHHTWWHLPPFTTIVRRFGARGR